MIQKTSGKIKIVDYRTLRYTSRSRIVYYISRFKLLKFTKFIKLLQIKFQILVYIDFSRFKVVIKTIYI